jgi:hypothetical protein
MARISIDSAEWTTLRNAVATSFQGAVAERLARLAAGETFPLVRSAIRIVGANSRPRRVLVELDGDGGEVRIVITDRDPA